jgi:hypothetical protein
LEVTGEDIAEQIVWVASRPDHVQVAELRESPIYDPIQGLTGQSYSPLLKLLLPSTTRGHRNLLEMEVCEPKVTAALHRFGTYNTFDISAYMDRILTTV